MSFLFFCFFFKIYESRVSLLTIFDNIIMSDISDRIFLENNSSNYFKTILNDYLVNFISQLAIVILLDYRNKAF